MRVRPLWIALLLFGADQVTKSWVRHVFLPGESRPLIEGVLHLTYVQNTGAAFGMLQGKTLLLILVTLAVGAVAFVHRSELKGARPPVQAAYALGIAGAVGNLWDRISLGWVTDFVDLRVWPVFNVADSAIFIAVVILIWNGWVLDRGRAKRTGSTGSEA